MNHRTPYRLRDVALIAGVVAAMACFTAYLGPSPDDIRADLAVQQSIVDAQEQARVELRRDLAAAKLCREIHGEAGYQWTAAGQLVCTPRKGKPTPAKSNG